MKEYVFVCFFFSFPFASLCWRHWFSLLEGLDRRLRCAHVPTYLPPLRGLPLRCVRERGNLIFGVEDGNDDGGGDGGGGSCGA